MAEQIESGRRQRGCGTRIKTFLANKFAFFFDFVEGVGARVCWEPMISQEPHGWFNLQNTVVFRYPRTGPWVGQKTYFQELTM